MNNISLLNAIENYQDKEGIKIILISNPKDFDKFLRPIIYDAFQTIDFKKLSSCVLPQTKYITSKNVEKEFGISEKTLEYWRSEGIGPAYIQIGKRIYYERKELEYFFKSCEIKTSGFVDV